MALRVGIIGTGAPNTGLNPEEVTQSGFSVAYRHAPCYLELEETELVGCADLVEEYRDVFAETFDLPAGNAYEDYVQMIEELELDFVDVCTPAHVHTTIVVDCARTASTEYTRRSRCRTRGEVPSACLRSAGDAACSSRSITSGGSAIRFARPSVDWRTERSAH